MPMLTTGRFAVRGHLARRTSALALAAALVLTLLDGCADATGPEQPKYPVSEETMASPERVAEFLPSLADEPARVLPGLADAAAASAIASHMGRLAGFLAARDAQAAAHEITLGREAVARYDRAAADRASLDAGELGVIELVFDHAARLIGLPATTR